MDALAWAFPDATTVQATQLPSGETRVRADHAVIYLPADATLTPPVTV